ncbi:MAG TPA: DUF2292 domain-containing protein [Candidatus Omnitrophica bacterium]|nr:DUF2292 domain-containing protein [Candidatus Omnitrophota bacterium]HBG63731.1 DUF2292 domain-containing protein [Candidatus Omnitrophota bacterium]HCD38085.1 DUF2292 domain-containing protein [Candidatus Omnitrophota bacterium]
MGISEHTLKNIINLAQGLKFGEIVIKIQDARIVAVEKHEKIRLDKIADSLKKEEAV